jgi:hypothetical protein
MSTPATITVRVNKAEFSILQDYAKFLGEPISTVLKKKAIEEAENSYYYNLAVEALHEHERDGKTFTLDEVASHIGA